MTDNVSSDELLVPLVIATGIGNPSQAMTLLAYRGASVLKDGKDVCMRLPDAIRWNEAEAMDASSRAERTFRQALAAHLKHLAAHPDVSTAYTPELWGHWARAFEEEARDLLTPARRDTPADLREIIRQALRT